MYLVPLCSGLIELPHKYLYHLDFFFFFFTLRFMVRLSVLLVTNLYSLNNFYEQIKKKLQMNVASYFEYIHCLVRVFRTAVI